MSEPAPELSVEELSQHPDMLGDAFDTLTHGRPLRLVGPDRRQLADVVPIGLVEELEETVAVLSDSDAVRALLEAREAATRGDVVRGVNAVRALLDERA
jgi:antitoxin YefM